MGRLFWRTYFLSSDLLQRICGKRKKTHVRIEALSNTVIESTGYESVPTLTNDRFWSTTAFLSNAKRKIVMRKHTIRTNESRSCWLRMPKHTGNDPSFRTMKNCTYTEYLEYARIKISIRKTYLKCLYKTKPLYKTELMLDRPIRDRDLWR